MLTPEQIQQIRPKLLSIQIVSAALIAGVVVMIGVLSFVVDWNNFNDQLKMLTLIGFVSGFLILGLSFVMPSVFASGQIHASANETIESAAGKLMTENLIRFALIEAAIFLNLMVFFIEPHIASLVITGIGLLLMLSFFPRQSRMIAAIEDRVG